MNWKADGNGMKKEKEEQKPSFYQIKEDGCITFHEDYTGYVNIKQGTSSEPRFSTGNTLPLVCAPFGMNSFCLQTKGSDGGWFYHPAHKQSEGVRFTHQPSPWVRDYGHFVFMPQSGEPYISENTRSSGFEEIAMNPAYMEVYFKRYQARMCIAPSERGAVLKIKWNTHRTPRFAILPFDFPAAVNLDAEKAELSGYVNAYGDGTRRDFKMYFHMRFDQPVDRCKTVITRNTGEISSGTSSCGNGAGINIAFSVSEGEELTVRLATSFVSAENARLNLEREIGIKTCGELRMETAAKWNGLLSKIEITAAEEEKRTFYSCFYRCFLFPHTFYDMNQTGEAVHYSAKSGEIHKGVMYTDNGFWDTYRTLYPLFALIIPDRLKEILEGYLNFYKEEGWLPKWISPGERGIMPGTLIDAVLADAAVKGILTREQSELALEAVLKNATTPGDTKLNGRQGIRDYVKLGYVPSDKYAESVNNSLDAYYCDFCISQLADKLGRSKIRDEYLARSQGYELLFDSKAGFIRGRKADGSRSSSFSPTEWGGGYCEGGAWQNGFAVYHDIDRLALLYGGKQAFAEKLDELFRTPPVFEIGTYPCEIHEMTEMSYADFGQCAISNQPSFHIPYLYSAIGYPQKTAYWVRKIINEGFGRDFFPGDEDNGSMSAWYIFSFMGFYPLCPGKAEYITGTCGAERVVLHLENGNTLVLGNNREIKDTVITHEQIMAGGNLYLYEGGTV